MRGFVNMLLGRSGNSNNNNLASWLCDVLEPETDAERLSSIYAQQQLQRSAQKQNILMQIHNSEKCRDGGLSELQQQMWDEYRCLDDQERELTRLERATLIEMEMPYDEEHFHSIQAEARRKWRGE